MGMTVGDGFLATATSAWSATFASQVRERLTENSRDLHPDELEILIGANRHALDMLIQARISRTLVLEFQISRMKGHLDGKNPNERWQEFLTRAGEWPFWEELFEIYPALHKRVEALVNRQTEVTVELGRRLSSDREAIRAFVGDGLLTSIEPALGDTHKGGRTVTLLHFGNRPIVYKPRSLDSDMALANLLCALNADAETSIRVPRVIQRDGYGWAEFIEHRFCSNKQEIENFYFGIGAWAAVMLLLRGTDMHYQNLIASGPVPFIIDCETLFSPYPNPGETVSDATSLAVKATRNTVLNSMLLPWRNLGSQGETSPDISAIGALPSEQPEVLLPVFVDIGSDDVRLDTKRFPALRTPKNHPMPDPEPEAYINDIVAGFRNFSERMAKLDQEGALHSALRRFAGCEMRVVPRATQAYVEFGRFLWHPSSLANEAGASKEVEVILSGRNELESLLASCPHGVRGEVEELIADDVPLFTFKPGEGIVRGHNGISIGSFGDLVEDALSDWRSTDYNLQESIIRSSVHGVRRNGSHTPANWVPFTGKSLSNAEESEIDCSRRRTAAELAKLLLEKAIRGKDRTATWLGVAADRSGLGAISQDLYGGHSGILVALAAYSYATNKGRADRIDGINELISEAVNFQQVEASRNTNHQRRHLGIAGVGGEIWAWLSLSVFTDDETALVNACRAADELFHMGSDDQYDVIFGSAGSIVPLINLAEKTKSDKYLDMAVMAAERLHRSAVKTTAGEVYWPTPAWPNGLGGFAHGATGIGWALARLGIALGEVRWERLAARAFRLDERLYEPKSGGWKDARSSVKDFYPLAWCHGAVGIGLAASDLAMRGDSNSGNHLEILTRAVEFLLPRAIDDDSLCHGNMAAWELLKNSEEFLTEHLKGASEFRSRIIRNLSERGVNLMISDISFTPGLYDGVGGVLYQLLRMDPELSFPSPLLLESSSVTDSY